MLKLLARGSRSNENRDLVNQIVDTCNPKIQFQNLRTSNF